jgi:hypothetical protein
LVVAVGSYLLNPITLKAFQQQVVLNGQTISPGALALVSTTAAAISVNAPVNGVDRACFAVFDVDGTADVNAITVSGNGSLIDGLSSVVLSTSDVEAVFVWDSTAGQWTRQIPGRAFADTQAIPLYRMADVAGGESPSSSGYLTQADWYFDAVAGSDSNTGATVGAPLKTFTEWHRRIGDGALNPAYDATRLARLVTLHLLTSMGVGGGQLDLTRVRMATDVALCVDGSAAIGAPVRSGTFTTVTAKNPATNQPFVLVDSSLPAADSWKDYVGYRCRISSGARAGVIMWIDKDMSAAAIGPVAKGMQPSDPQIPTALTGASPTSIFSAAVTQTAPQVGDPYVVEAMPTISLVGYNVTSAGVTDIATSNGGVVLLQQVSINVTGEGATYFSGNTKLITTSCHSFQIFSSCRHYISVCDGVSDFEYEGVAMFVALAGKTEKRGGTLAGLYVPVGGNWSLMQCYPGAMLLLEYDTQVMGGQIQVSGVGLHFNSACVWDTPSNGNGPVSGNAVYLGSPFLANPTTSAPGTCAVLARCSLDANVRLWGSGAAGTGVAIGPGCTFAHTSGIYPTLVGATDYRLGGASTARPWDETTNAYLSARNTTWALLAATLAGGGFAGQAHNVAADAHVIVNA